MIVCENPSPDWVAIELRLPQLQDCGSYRMVLKGVDEIDWFTDRPNRVEGTWKPQKLLRRWDKYFATSEPNAKVTVEDEEQRELFTFEMFKPKITSKSDLKFKVKPLSENGKDKLTDLVGKELDIASLFIDDASTSAAPSCNLTGANLNGAYLSSAVLKGRRPV